MDDFFEISTHYQVKYTNQKPVPIADIVESLQAYERLLQLTPAFIELAYQGITITQVDVYIQSLETGSLLEAFVIRYVFRGRESYEQAKQVFEKIMDNSEAIRLLVATGVGAYLMYGIVKSMPENQPAVHIENVQHSIINVGAKAGLSEADIKTVLESTPDKKKLAKNALQALAPARLDSSAAIEVDGFTDLTLPPEAIAEAPEEYVAPVPDKKIENYSNVDVIIYASDRDKRDKGWAGLVPGIVDKRVKFELNEEIDPAQLHGRTRIKADISVTSKYYKSRKTFVPQLVRILCII